MFGIPRYLIPGNRDKMTCYIMLHAGNWGNVESALRKAVSKGKRNLTVDLTDSGSPAGDDMYVFKYTNIEQNTGQQSTEDELPCNSITFKLNRKGRVLSYSYDAIDDNFDCTINLKGGFVRGKSSRPMKLSEIVAQSEITRSQGLGAGFGYFDRQIWSIQQYGTVTAGGAQILA